jgi:hypothetical protein
MKRINPLAFIEEVLFRISYLTRPTGGLSLVSGSKGRNPELVKHPWERAIMRMYCGVF